MPDVVSKIEKKIGYCFSDKRLALQSLTHKSFSNEQADDVTHNERLEFLGDAVLELAVSDWVYKNYPDVPEGGLTRLRAEVVSEKGLAGIADRLGLGDGLRLGKGEEKSGGRSKPSLLSDALEAVLGAVYLDGGFESAYRVVDVVFSREIEEKAQQRYGSDFKTLLQERLQAAYNQLPEYHLVATSGPDHERIYRVEVHYNGRLIGAGSGPSKKSAEQSAAAEAMQHDILTKDFN